MAISFQGDQYFHPIYGWIDKYRPDIERQNAPNALPAGRLLELTQSNVKEILGNDVNLNDLVKVMLAAAEENKLSAISASMPEDWYEKNISVHPYMGVQGYQFNYSGNELTIRIEGNLNRNSPIDVFRDYEQQCKNIQELKKYGYNDEAIKMLQKELDDQLLKAESAGIEAQLWGMGFKDWEISGVFRKIAQEYLNLRDGVSSYDRIAEMAVNNLVKRGVLPEGIDIYWGKSGEIGRLQGIIDSQMSAIEAPFKSFQQSFSTLAASIQSKPSNWFDIAQTHILSLNNNNNWANAPISDAEKEARTSSIIFRVRGTQLADYGRRYEEISAELDKRLSTGEISASDYNIYRADLDNAFIKTQNLNIVGQALAAGLSEEKAAELATTFSMEYLNIRSQYSGDEINSEKIANAALLKIAENGWPAFSLYSSEDRATASQDDPWYSIMAENALYYYQH